MTNLWIHDWDKWQSYRGDRGTPPWIKVHRGLFTSRKWATLTDAEKGQIVSIWIVAADNGGCIPYDERILRKICMLDDTPDIKKFIEIGLIDTQQEQHDVTVTPRRQPSDPPETETETEEEPSLKLPLKEPVKEDYKTKKGKTLKNRVLSDFNLFWESFDYKNGKAEAADAFINVYSPAVFDDIISGAKNEAKNREELKAKGRTPKMAQGWLSGRRWEDEKTEKENSQWE